MKRAVLRGVGITLIALPEPFTTPFGVALVAASYLIPHRQGDSRANVRAVVREYAATYRPFGTGAAFVAAHEPGKRQAETERTGLFYMRDVMPPRTLVPVPDPPPRVRHHRLSDALSPVHRGIGGMRDSFVGYWGRQQIVRPSTGLTVHTNRWAAIAAN
jgi:hypothetical protein